MLLRISKSVELFRPLLYQDILKNVPLEFILGYDSWCKLTCTEAELWLLYGSISRHIS